MEKRCRYFYRQVRVLTFPLDIPEPESDGRAITKCAYHLDVPAVNIHDGLADADIGKHFKEVYNLDTLEPTSEWQQIYLTVSEELADLGISL